MVENRFICHRRQTDWRRYKTNPEKIGDDSGPVCGIGEKVYPMRLWYMFKREICAVIDVDEHYRKVMVHNFTNDFLLKPFGKIAEPTFEEYEAFLESRCFPRSRDKMKLILKELDLPFYEPLIIIEKTQGKMAEDDFWIRIER